MNIKILGTGCARCRALSKAVREITDQMQADITIEEVKDMKQILEYPILSTPGLVIDEQLVYHGQVPKKEEIEKLIASALKKQE